MIKLCYNMILADKMADLARRLQEASSGADVVDTTRTLFQG